jgi:hypothetical protein
MRSWVIRAKFILAAFFGVFLLSSGNLQAQRGSVLVLSGSTNATNYEPLIIPSSREPVFVPAQPPEASGGATPDNGTITVTGQGDVPSLSTTPDASYNSITSSPPGVPIIVTNVPAGVDNQEILDNSPYPLAPPPFVVPPPPFGGTGTGTVSLPAAPATPTTTTPLFSPGIATPPPPLPGLPPALPGGQPGLSSGSGVAGQPPGAPPGFTRAPGSRF